ncbi:MAG: hypothetical protein C0467_16465 [Planctomycetaceae bacterium]|nr:hypothetical protein [Planctomycetaceae bacterium]
MSHNLIDDRELIAAYKAGSESSARELFDRYCEKLMRTARRMIGHRMVSRIDPEDAVQSAFRTFFSRVKSDQFTFEGESAEFRILVRLTVNKTLRQIAHHRAAKRNPNREIPQGEPDHSVIDQLTAEEPLPDVQLALIEEFEHFLSLLSAFDRRVLELKFEGYTTTEIVEKLRVELPPLEARKVYDRKVRRVIERAAALAEGRATAEAEE